MASNAENVSIWWRHHGKFKWRGIVDFDISLTPNSYSITNQRAIEWFHWCHNHRKLNPLINCLNQKITWGGGGGGGHAPVPFVHDDVIKWKPFPRYWPFVRRIHRSPVNSPHKGQWRGALMFCLICAWINGWVNIVRLVIWDAIALIMKDKRFLTIHIERNFLIGRLFYCLILFYIFLVTWRNFS